VYIIVFSLIFANILTSSIGLIFLKYITVILRVPVPRLLPIITIVALTASFIVRNNFVDMSVAVVFGVIGLALVYVGTSRVPFAIAFVLAGLLEHNFYLAIQLNQGDALGALFNGSLNQLLIILILVSVVGIYLPLRDYVTRFVVRIFNLGF
jgi:putative tricarboxylic transport membrane protein